MSDYRRHYVEGGCYFFTVVTHGRSRLLTEGGRFERLTNSFHYAIRKRPFVVEAMVVLPDHLHCIWNMPQNDADFSIRWMLIKRHFSAGIKAVPNDRREKPIWQRRFWEHRIRDEQDLERHMDYVFYNPVKHGYVKRPADWEYGSLRQAIARGLYAEGWGAEEPRSVTGLELE
ncbi:MAG: transposase [bacterium]